MRTYEFICFACGGPCREDHVSLPSTSAPPGRDYWYELQSSFRFTMFCVLVEPSEVETLMGSLFFGTEQLIFRSVPVRPFVGQFSEWAKATRSGHPPWQSSVVILPWPGPTDLRLRFNRPVANIGLAGFYDNDASS